MRIRTFALALLLGIGAGTVAPAAQNPSYRAAKKRAKQNRKAVSRRVKSQKSTAGKTKPFKQRKSK